MPPEVIGVAVLPLTMQFSSVAPLAPPPFLAELPVSVQPFKVTSYAPPPLAVAVLPVMTQLETTPLPPSVPVTPPPSPATVVCTPPMPVCVHPAAPLVSVKPDSAAPFAKYTHRQVPLPLI